MVKLAGLGFSVFISMLILAASGASGAERRPVVDYPNKPIRWIVPFPPGGAADIVTLSIAVKLTESWRQQVIIDNRPGAGGNLGAELAAQAPNDGYTLITVPATHSTNPTLQQKLRYDPVKDFAPITLLASSPLILVVHPSISAKTVPELTALAKARPGGLNYASSGIGASAHLAAELYKVAAGLNIVHVPYKGQPPAMFDLLSGQVHMMFPNMPVVLPHVKAGKLRPLAVTTLKRSPLMQELPTMAESGLPGFEVSQWSGLLAPAGTPRAIIGKLNTTIVQILRLPDVNAILSNQGLMPVGNSPQEFDAYIRAEIVKWAKVIRDAGIKAE